MHLCGGACPDRLEADNLLHGVSINKRVEEDLPWMSNLVEAGEPVRRPVEGGLLGGEAKEKGGGDRGREKEKTTSKKSDRGDKKKRKSRERDRSRSRSREKISLRGGAKKKLEEVLGGTGLSPDPRFRRRFANKAQKRVKKRRRSSSSSSSNSSSGSYSGESAEVFAEEHQIRRIAKRAPGLLAAQALKEMQGALLTSTGGIWQQEETELHPLSIQYYRQAMAPRLQGAPSREALCHRPHPARQGGRIGRLSGSEIEKYRTGFAGSGVANSSEARGSTSGTSSVIHEERSKRGNPRTERGIQDQVGGLPGEGERRRMEECFLERERRRRQQKRKGDERQRQEGKAEGGAKEVTARGRDEGPLAGYEPLRRHLKGSLARWSQADAWAVFQRT